MLRQSTSSLVFCAAVAFGSTAHAGVITFTDNVGYSYPATVTETIAGTGEGVGATAIFGNVIKEGGSGLYFGGGLGLGSGGIGYSWTVAFDQAVTWTATTLTYSGSNLGFNVTGAGVNAQDMLQGASTGWHELSTPLLFQANETYTFTSNNICASTQCGAVLFGEWTFGALETTTEASPVPEPSTIALLGLGMLGLGFARRT